MADEVSNYLEKARRSLNNARMIFAAGITEDAGRAAYIAAFSAAQALIFAETGKEAIETAERFVALISEILTSTKNV